MNRNEVSTTKPKTAVSWMHMVLGYLMLAVPYHAAEYAMRFHQHVPLFLGGMLLVVVMAFVVAKWQGYGGLGAWGLGGTSWTLSWLGLGLVLGLVCYTLAFLVRLWLQIEVITAVPDRSTLVSATLMFALGTFLPSLAEDILTRGYVYQHLKRKVSSLGFILISALLYVLNHVYALGSGPTQLLYLFVLGLVLAVPLVNTQNLWYTVGVHWAGNIVYRFSSDVLSVDQGTNSFPGLWELIFFLLLLLVVNDGVTKSISSRRRVQEGG